LTASNVLAQVAKSAATPRIALRRNEFMKKDSDNCLPTRRQKTLRANTRVVINSAMLPIGMIWAV
jgi:hypothetical protein